MFYFHLKPLISPTQHGFFRCRSTTSNLLDYKSYLCNAFAKRLQVDAIYTDFSKAFDKVDHKILCTKLKALGFHGNLLRWIISYLSKRSQLVALKGDYSSPVFVTSGVPQGSHLGPLFFIAFINDIVNNLSCPTLLYADDLKIFSTIDSMGDAMNLQRDLDAIDHWCINNKMSLNLNKCNVISFTTKTNKIIFPYTINSHLLERKFVVKDLGVIFDDKLTFKQHYDEITERGSRLLGFIARITKQFKRPTSFIYLFCSLIRSVLEYNSVIWSPYYAVHMNRIESVQKRCLKLLSYRFNLNRAYNTYPDLLSKFKIHSLENRRDLNGLIILHKIIHSYIDCPSLLSNINFNTFQRCRNPKLFLLRVYLNNTSFFNPLTRMCRQYNELVDSNADVDIFDNNKIRYINKLKAIFFG